jgi:hypothetical protein
MITLDQLADILKKEISDEYLENADANASFNIAMRQQVVKV